MWMICYRMRKREKWWRFKAGPPESTVKHNYSEHAYYELVPTAKWFSFPVTLLHILNLTDKTNYAYNKSKIAHRYKHVFYTVLSYI